MKTFPLGMALLAVSASALAAPPTRKTSPKAAQRPPPCQRRAPERSNWPQSALLWGTTRQLPEDERSSVLASLGFSSIRLRGAPLADVRLENGRLLAPSRAPEDLVGATLQGFTSNNQPVEVALCSAETSPNASSLSWYRIELWNAESASWVNPCVATPQAPQPRVLAVPGVWDSSGARRDEPGRFTFACEGGAIAKCVTWGYKPWDTRNGQPLTELHQACTRMARADYCGDGRSYTHNGTRIDVHDKLGVQEWTTEASAHWQPQLGTFEAAWDSEGASCLAHTRDGRSPESILSDCPDRFEPATVELGEGNTCSLRRKGSQADTTLLHNRSYGPSGHLAQQSP